MGTQKLSIIIPSVNDPSLQKTIDDMRENAELDNEIIVVADGMDIEVEGAQVIRNEKNLGLRASVNKGIAASTGEYIMKIDDHCRFDKGFDTKMLEHLEDNMIMIPRRYFLDTDNWEIMDDKPVDYERLVVNNPDKIGGATWRTRARQRKDIMIDETMVFQGSCYFMARTHWDRLGDLQEEGYGPFTQEPIELSLKTWLGGGRVMVNKNTWYAHKHRKFGRVKGNANVKEGNAYSRDYWLNNRWEDRIHDLDWLLKKFEL